MYNFAPGPYYEIIFDAPSEDCFNHPNGYRSFFTFVDWHLQSYSPEGHRFATHFRSHMISVQLLDLRTGGLLIPTRLNHAQMEGRFGWGGHSCDYGVLVFGCKGFDGFLPPRCHVLVLLVGEPPLSRGAKLTANTAWL